MGIQCADFILAMTMSPDAQAHSASCDTMTTISYTTLRFIVLFAALLSSALLAPKADAQSEISSLSGQWRFLMNGPKPGVQQGALPDLPFNDTIALPGTTETRRKGSVQGSGWSGALTRVYRFEGPAWYQREITVPAHWRTKRVTLFLELTKYTQVWLDDKALGENSLITAPHEYVLGTLQPGTHRLTIAVDNTRAPAPGDNHQTSNNTQGNWNGILGRMELRATDAVWLDDVQTYPDVAKRVVTVKAVIGNSSTQSGNGFVTVAVKGKGVSTQPLKVPVTWSSGGGAAEIAVPLGRNAALWDEFNPSLHVLTIKLQSAGSSSASSDERSVTFGLRNFATKGSQFAINGRTTFLRGRHDAAVFPLTGHVPMEVEGWLRYFRIVRSYGLNHVRFHSWTPPEAAFSAADQIGVYLQPELPFWGDFNEQVKAALKPEGHNIMRRFGNHPSFVMFALGNENRFSRDIMASVVSELRALDNRHLYTQGSNAFAWDPQLQPGDDYLTSARVKNSPQTPSRNVRGSHAGADHADGHVQAGPPNTMKDYAEAISGIPRPVIGHEVGQYTVYPNFREISKYTGVMRAHNFEYFQKKLADAGMLDQADEFFRASGELSALCYREEIETALRTPGFGGFHLLDLQDFPGQGTALVGMLDAFMDSKGLITPEEWRQFCNSTVILARFPKYTWTSGERFNANIQVAHYGENDLPRSVLTWTLREAGAKPASKPLASGRLRAANIRQGTLSTLEPLSVPLAVVRPMRLNLEIQLRGSTIKTSYPLWVYPAQVSTRAPAGVTIAQTLDASTRERLSRGERVVLVTSGTKPLARTVGGGFATDFWNFPMFHNNPGTMGLLSNPTHPALGQFPTEFHSNWQWFNLVMNSQPLILDALPKGYRPLVQVIDNNERVHRLGLIFELKVGPGRLLVCATDLLAQQDKPEARQLLAGLLQYAGSNQFNPQTEATMDQVQELLLLVIPMKGKATASSRARGWQAQGPEQATDGNDYTEWRAERQASGEQWWQFTFDEPQNLRDGEILWSGERSGYKYLVQGSTDGTTWQVLSDQRDNALAGARHKLSFSATGIRAVRVSITGLPERAEAGIREMKFFQPEPEDAALPQGR